MSISGDFKQKTVQLMVGVVAILAASLSACIPTTRSNLRITANTTSGNSSIFSSSGTTSLTPSQQVCSNYDSGTPFRDYCDSCVLAVLALYCPGQSEPTGCSSSIQASFNSRVNQCINNTLTLGFACARTCGSGTVLDITCNCVTPPPPTYSGNSGLPTSDLGLLNVGAPVSTAVFYNNAGASSDPLNCQVNLNLDLTVTNRSLTHPRTNTYILDTSSLGYTANQSFVASAGPFASYEDPIRNIHARSPLGLVYDRSPGSSPYGRVSSLGRVERYSGRSFMAESASFNNSSTVPVSTALWSPLMGQIVSRGSDLFIADTANDRVRRIDTSADTVAGTIFNSSTSQILLDGPYGIAVDSTSGNLFVGQFGASGGQNNTLLFPLGTSSVVSQCNSDDNGFCEPTDCLEREVTGSYIPSGTLQSPGAACPTSGYRVQVHQAKTIAGMDFNRTNSALYLALPHEKKLRVVRTPTARTPRSASGTWTAGNSLFTISSGANFQEGEAVTVWGQDSCLVFFSTFVYDDLPSNLNREQIYYVVNKSGASLSLALSPGGAPISLNNTRSISGAPCGGGGNQTTGNITLAQWAGYGIINSNPTVGLNLPVDVKVSFGGVSGNFAYVADAGTGILWRATLTAAGVPTGTWTQVNVLPAIGTAPPDQAVGSPGAISIRLINLVGLAISPNNSASLDDDVLLIEGQNSNPFTQPGGTTVRIFCANNDISGALNVSAPCKGKNVGIYRLAGTFQGHQPSGSAPASAVFANPTSIAIAGGVTQLASTTATYLVGSGVDAGIFRLSPQSESPLLGLKFSISDIYNQTAHQCLQFHTTVSCSSATECVCSAIPPMDPAVRMWQETGATDSCEP